MKDTFEKNAVQATPAADAKKSLGISFGKDALADKDILILPVFENAAPALPESMPDILKKFITEAVDGDKTFKGAYGQKLVFPGVGGLEKVVLLGVGKEKDLDEKAVRRLAGVLDSAAAGKKVGIDASLLGDKSSNALFAANLADAILSNSYEFKKYKTGKAGKSKNPAAVEILTAAPATQARDAFSSLRTVTDSVSWASDLVNEPGNVLNPATYAEKIRDELAPLGIKVRVIEFEEMKKLGMGAAAAVGQGSATPPCMVVMEYDGSAGEQKRPLALVGKGITFDSGGISIKPGAGMDDMTMDMGGSAAMVGTMRALASRGAKANVVAIVALAENMPSGTAYRPGDIVTSLSGKTIHIGNTDAEGRLVLCDAMTFIQRTYNPHTMIDAATLTGAAVVALGTEFSALYTNDESLSKKFNKASKSSGEKVWRMPLLETEAFARTMRSTPFADLTNIGGRAGSCTAAAFLREFVEKDADGNDKCKWAHIDMAGPGIPPGQDKKGWGVLLLNQLISDAYEVEAKQPAPKASPKAKVHLKRKP